MSDAPAITLRSPTRRVLVGISANDDADLHAAFMLISAVCLPVETAVDAQRVRGAGGHVVHIRSSELESLKIELRPGDGLITHEGDQELLRAKLLAVVPMCIEVRYEKEKISQRG